MINHLINHLFRSEIGKFRCTQIEVKFKLKINDILKWYIHSYFGFKVAHHFIVVWYYV